MRLCLCVCLLFFVVGCSSSSGADTRFTLLPGKKTGITFSNDLDFDKDFNVYTYRNFYNGGGVAIIDVNNDGLQDVYFTSNMSENKLYLNEGDFSFTDITESSGAAGTKAWSTGVSAVDINADGFMDLYVCNSGDVDGDDKRNELFVNNGDNTFTERAEEYGLADEGLSTHGIFFDYDQDGDLDMYLLNNSYRAITSFNLQENERLTRDVVGGDKLYRNDSGQFVDASEEAGIYGSVIGFGLGASVGDVNGDFLLDIYVSNDFFERDYLYINNGDGTFTEGLSQAMKSISNASMGADMADLTGDGYPELFVTEMLPEFNERIKTKTTFESWDKQQLAIANDYHYQYTRNMLQLNNGDGTFSEVGRFAGVEATDWSWAALLTDFDLDGQNDIFVANGLYQDITDRDYVDFASSAEVKQAMITKEGVNFKELIDIIPSNKLSNYLFQNQGYLEFDNVSEDWGLATPSHSNGSTYADLDNDGDLDLLVNNTNMEAFVYRNNTMEQQADIRILRFKLKGPESNPNAVGAILTFSSEVGESHVIQHIPNRGFQSSVDNRVTLSNNADFNRVTVVIGENYFELPVSQSDKIQVLDLSENSNTFSFQNNEERTDFVYTDLPFQHKENPYSEFNQEGLLYHMLSTEGPALAVADVNGDGLEDAYFGGAKGQIGQLLLQSKDGDFTYSGGTDFSSDINSEDVDALFFDADSDGDQDLYVVSGGSEFSPQAPALYDRLYLNNGRGKFTKTAQLLPSPTGHSSGSTAAAHDFDRDGDIDLFIGSRSIPRLYGANPTSFLLQNDGMGNFSVYREFKDMGMVTSATWADLNGDGRRELAVVGEWMGLHIISFKGGQHTNIGLPNTSGWWNSVLAKDFDGDGDMDLIAGNHGLNSRFTCSESEPMTMVVNDFDRNGTVEQIINCYSGGRSYPMQLRHDLIRQVPSLKKKFLKYESFKDATVEDIFSTEELNGSIYKEVKTLESSIFINDGQGNFQRQALPLSAQLSPVFDIVSIGNQLILGGNFYSAKPDVGRYDASRGLLLQQNEDGSWQEEHLGIEGEIRNLVVLNNGRILAARNNDKAILIEVD